MTNSAQTQTEPAVKASESEVSASTGAPVFWWLALLAVISSLIYGAIYWASAEFVLTNPGKDRPIIWTLSLFSVAFVIYLISIVLACRTKQSFQLGALIIGFAMIFRLTLLFSQPIQEVDIHRYIWDGVVCTQGISPFRYPPDQVFFADANNTTDPDLRRLATIRDGDETLHEILEKLNNHYGHLPTVYPPTSQAVFAAAAMTTPNNVSLATRVNILKSWLLLFDLGVVLLVMMLLRACGRPIGMAVAYAWCPLVLKEVANSGHLDAIAVFFCTLSLYLMIKEVIRVGQSELPSWGWFNLGRINLSAFCLAAAIGAKLYPIVLAPAVLLFSIRKFGWQTVFPTIVFSVSTVVFIWPMLPSSAKPQKSVGIAAVNETESLEEIEVDPSKGVKTFLQYWEMNDFVFMIVVENLKPSPTAPANPGVQAPPEVWFSVLSDEWRKSIVESQPVTSLAKRFDVAPPQVPFMLTRALTTVLFLLLAIWFAWRGSGVPDPGKLAEVAFLTLAWFWLLSPTQNPWYWMWAMPFLPFMRNRAWFALSGFAMIYYLRFWFGYQFPGIEVAGTQYQGSAFFDFVVPWIEFGPWFVWLVIEGMVYARSRSRE